MRRPGCPCPSVSAWPGRRGLNPPPPNRQSPKRRHPSLRLPAWLPARTHASRSWSRIRPFWKRRWRCWPNTGSRPPRSCSCVTINISKAPRRWNPGRLRAGSWPWPDSSTNHERSTQRSWPPCRRPNTRWSCNVPAAVVRCTRALRRPRARSGGAAPWGTSVFAAFAWATCWNT